eukprot:CAMPEP_0117441498 /NCGR_PEP_ID=MMETSP0759-20121206/3666_1 /TAXON_ID=63605 /ORGANISM="Percolomonas cosmopolitus, Strain WS" /LENGTH=445 /DNA_ID=CAMNT_0005233355 /DNA_START=198 /DNA_END=1536 /DNA_ORIENTATION=+
MSSLQKSQSWMRPSKAMSQMLKKGLECFDEDTGDKRRKVRDYEAEQQSDVQSRLQEPTTAKTSENLVGYQPQYQQFMPSSSSTTFASHQQHYPQQSPNLNVDDAFLDTLLEAPSNEGSSSMPSESRMTATSSDSASFFAGEASLEVDDSLFLFPKELSQQDNNDDLLLTSANLNSSKIQESCTYQTSHLTSSTTSSSNLYTNPASTSTTITSLDAHSLRAKIAQQQSFFHYQQQIINSLSDTLNQQSVILHELQNAQQNRPVNISTTVSIPNPFTSHFHTKTPVAMMSFTLSVRTLLCCNQAFCDLLGKPLEDLQMPRPATHFDYLMKQIEVRTIQVKLPIPQKGIFHATVSKENGIGFMKLDGPINFWDNSFTINGIHHPATISKAAPDKSDVLCTIQRMLTLVERPELYSEEMFKDICTSPIISDLLKPITQLKQSDPENGHC